MAIPCLEVGVQAEGVQAEVLGNPTFSLRPKSLQPEPLQPIYLSRYVSNYDRSPDR
jgi:hypothetical protein